MTERVQAEIEELHAIFVEWFAGTCGAERAEFDRRVTARMSDDFELIQPTGDRYDRERICEAIFAGHGANPAFEISIRNLEVKTVTAELVVATYEEWQKNAKSIGPADNARVSTVVFRRRGETLDWVHVHETWLPPVSDAT